jgi:Nitroreductase
MEAFIMEEIFNRRSIRKFESKPVEKEKIDRILRAAMQAPSAANQQPWEFIVVEDREALKKLAQMSQYSTPVAGSAVTLVLLGNFDNLKISDAWQQDMGAAAENILLEATHLGLGAVWIGAAIAESSVAFIKELYGLPEQVKPFSLIAIGYPDGQKNTFVDRYKAEKVHYGKY